MTRRDGRWWAVTVVGLCAAAAFAVAPPRSPDDADGKPATPVTPVAHKSGPPVTGPDGPPLILPETVPPAVELIPVAPRPVQAPKPAEAAPPSPERAALLGAARNSVRKGDLPTALSRFEEFLSKSPDDAAVRKEYAGVLVQAGRVPAAIAQYRDLLRGQPNDPELQQTLGDIYFLAKDYAAATTLLGPALAANPDNAELAVRLARAFALDGDHVRGLLVYERRLTHFPPGDEAAPRGLPLFLLDVDRPAAALPFLQTRREADAGDLEALAATIRARAKLGDRAKAIELAAELANKADSTPTRLGLGEGLYQSGEFELAALVFAQILQREPENGAAQVGSARVLLAQCQPAAARRILDSTLPSNADARRQLRLAWAEYHQLVGEYTVAKLTYRQLLRQNEDDHPVRLALGLLFEFVREDEKAKAEFLKIPPTAGGTWRRARVGLASVLTTQRLFPQALDVLQALLRDHPGDAPATAQLVRTLAKAKRFEEAEAAGRGYLASYPANELGALPVRLALGRALQEAGKFLESVPEYEALLAKPSGWIAETYYGLARAWAKTGDPRKAEQALAGAVSLVGGDFRNRLTLADLFAADQEDHPAADMARAVLKFDAHNLAALIRLADAQVRLARLDGLVKEALQTAEQILEQSPANTRGHLARARALGVGQDFKGSAAAYGQLIAADPEFVIPHREQARALFSAHDYGGAEGAYASVGQPAADSALQADLAELCQRSAANRDLLAPYVAAQLTGAQYQVELPKVLAGNAEVQAAVSRAFLDYHARTAEQNCVRLEAAAKRLKDARNREAVSAYQAWTAAEPADQEAWFDLGQVYGALQQNREEQPAYAQALEIDPLHREAAAAGARSVSDTRPRLWLGFDYFGQQGRDRLAEIGRAKYAAQAIIPYGDENEFVGVGLARVAYTPQDGPTLYGDFASVMAQGKCCDGRLVGFAQVNYEQYPDRLSSRPTFEAAASYDVTDVIRLRTRLFLENVVENGESLRQDIYRGGVDVGADFRPTRRWSFGGIYRVAPYSDHNLAQEMDLYNEYSITLPPKQLKLVGLLQYLGYSESTVFGPNPGDPLIGAVHPYFSPRTYTYAELRLEWYHWFSRDYFVHSQQCYYSLQYGVGVDSRSVGYHDLRALLYCDVNCWLTAAVGTRGTLSEAYKNIGTSVYLIARF